MPRARKWNDAQLLVAVQSSYSYRSVIKKLDLIPAGGNYVQVKKRISDLKINTDHFSGARWNKGISYKLRSTIPIGSHLVKDSNIQSYKLKHKLFEAKLMYPKCEICGWNKQSTDGRIPVELDHINGDRTDNRLVNLRILCPNCHSLQPTHRGKNKRHH